MRHGIILITVGVLAATVSLPVLRAQNTESPREDQGQVGSAGPDLSGIWLQVGNVTFDPADPQGKNAANLPFTPWGLSKYKTAKPAHGAYQNLAGVSNDPANQCFQPGLPRVYLQPYPMEIIQTPSRVVMLFEYGELFREIYMDGRQHPKDEDLGPCRWGTQWVTGRGILSSSMSWGLRIQHGWIGRAMRTAISCTLWSALPEWTRTLCRTISRLRILRHTPSLGRAKRFSSCGQPGRSRNGLARTAGFSTTI